MKKESSYENVITALRRAACMIFALGIPWAFAYLMMVSRHPAPKEMFSFLFSVFNSFQVRSIPRFLANFLAFFGARSFQVAVDLESAAESLNLEII